MGLAVGGIVLAGGRSRRMGQDKALLDRGGEPLLRRVARRLAAATDQFVVGPAERFAAAVASLGVKLLPDRWRGRGPLASLDAGRAAVRQPVAVGGCDMPALEPTPLRFRATLSDEHEVALPVLAGRVEPLPLPCRTRLLPAIERLLAGIDDPPLEAVEPVDQSRSGGEAAPRVVRPGPERNPASGRARVRRAPHRE